MKRLFLILAAATALTYGTDNFGKVFDPETGELFRKSINRSIFYKGFIQFRTDCGELLFKKDHFSDRCDSYIRRAEVKFRFHPSGGFYIYAKLAADNLFRNYYAGKEKLKPKKVVFKKLYALWKVDKEFLVEFGRDKKPFSRIGLSSAERTLLADKAETFLAFKKALGDYYAEQLEIFLKPIDGWKFYLATSYTWSLKDKNLLPKGYKLSESSYWLNNLWGRIEFSPKGWEEGKKNNTTFGKKVFVLGLSTAGFWNLKANTSSGKRNLKVLAEEVDLFFRSPRWEMGRFTLLGEYERVEYLLKGLPNSSLEGFDAQVGFRPGNQRLWELGADYERLQKHPAGTEENIYRAGFNLYPIKHLKVSYTFAYTDWSGKFSDRPQRVHTVQFQITF